MRRLFSFAVLLAPLLTLPGSAQAGSTFDFAVEARSFLEASGQPITGQTFQEFIDGSAFVRVELGAFDLRMPVLSFEDRVLTDRLKSAAETLVALQQVWHGWLGTAREFEEVDGDLATLRDWVKGWTGRKLSKCEGGERSLFEQLGAKKQVLEAAARLILATQHTAARYPREAVIVAGASVTVLAPNREIHVKIAAVGGLLDPAKQATLWHPNVVAQSAAWFDWIQIVGLENTTGVDWANPYEGIAYTELDKTGLAQHVSDRGGIILLRKEFWKQGTHFFEDSLGTNLVIATVGKNGVHSGDWEYGYKRKGGSTKPQQRFVPGGNPAGGTLPKRKAKAGPTTHSSSADELGHYLTSLGVDFYLDPVRNGQRKGAKLALKQTLATLRKHTRPHFHLYSLETHTSTYVTAPFLGRPAEGKVLPDDEYLDDYEDFFGAYRSCFANWLETRAGGSPEDSAEYFATLLEKHAERGTGVGLDDIVEEVYGVPLSGVGASTDSLEWRYLGWLQKGK
jgi:hypothetical protein